MCVLNPCVLDEDIFKSGPMAAENLCKKEMLFFCIDSAHGINLAADLSYQ